VFLTISLSPLPNAAMIVLASLFFGLESGEQQATRGVSRILLANILYPGGWAVLAIAALV
jgi:hypothetical protein